MYVHVMYEMVFACFSAKVSEEKKAHGTHQSTFHSHKTQKQANKQAKKP